MSYIALIFAVIGAALLVAYGRGVVPTGTNVMNFIKGDAARGTHSPYSQVVGTKAKKGAVETEEEDTTDTIASAPIGIIAMQVSTYEMHCVQLCVVSPVQRFSPHISHLKTLP
jgi:hypothetical protein